MFRHESDKFGTFVVSDNGLILSLKLQHISGDIACIISKNITGKWGCGGNLI